MITLVKKILADGSPCKKCADVLSRLEKGGYMPRVSRVVVADERDPSSEGMLLAAKYGVETAPFFIVEREGTAPVVYTLYTRLLREVLEAAPDDGDTDREIADRGGADFL